MPLPLSKEHSSERHGDLYPKAESNDSGFHLDDKVAGRMDLAQKYANARKCFDLCLLQDINIKKC